MEMIELHRLPVTAPVENAQPKAAKNRETERSKRVFALMEGRYREQVPTASDTTEGLSKKQTPLGKPEDRLTWTQVYGKEKIQYDGRQESTQGQAKT
jgi:hypothetical protein